MNQSNEVKDTSINVGKSQSNSVVPQSFNNSSNSSALGSNKRSVLSKYKNVRTVVISPMISHEFDQTKEAKELVKNPPD